ncbi:hypothetical protein HYALB_00013465 [Hymenoscyphus albidus]|uniref:Uncharacterized protein n=1 Tax=Hymenoscyphus albidus TaxID=595503 RepID=A0A9N9LUT4_9HELO|nr:hypothetical protein HYALB_00013465 [Hymenoscyphus albidus]
MPKNKGRRGQGGKKLNPNSNNPSPAPSNPGSDTETGRSSTPKNTPIPKTTKKVVFSSADDISGGGGDEEGSNASVTSSELREIRDLVATEGLENVEGERLPGNFSDLDDKDDEDSIESKSSKSKLPEDPEKTSPAAGPSTRKPVAGHTESPKSPDTSGGDFRKWPPELPPGQTLSEEEAKRMVLDTSMFAPPSSTKGPYASDSVADIWEPGMERPDAPSFEDRLKAFAAKVRAEEKKAKADKAAASTPPGGEYVFAKPTPNTPKAGPSGSKSSGKKPVYGDNFAKPTSTKGPYGTGVDIPVMGDGKDVAPRTPLRTRYKAWAEEPDSRDNSSSSSDDDDDGSRAGRPIDLKPKDTMGDDDLSDDPGSSPSLAKSSPEKPSVMPDLPQLTAQNVTPKKPMESSDEPLSSKKDKGKGKEPVAPTPKKPIKPKFNPIFEAYPYMPGTDLVDGKIPQHILDAPVVGRDDDRDFSRSPSPVFFLGTPVRTPVQSPTRSSTGPASPKKLTPIAEETSKGKEKVGGDDGGFAPATSTKGPYSGGVTVPVVGTQDDDTRPRTPPKEREAAALAGTGGTGGKKSDTPKSTTQTGGKKKGDTFEPPPATAPSKTGPRGLVMGRDDDILRPRTPPEVGMERREKERTQKEGARKKRPQSLLTASQLPTTPEMTAWRDFARKNPDRECITLANSAMDSLLSHQIDLVAENMELVALNKTYSEEYANIADINQALLANEQGVIDQYEEKVKALEEELAAFKAQDPEKDNIEKLKKDLRRSEERVSYLSGSLRTLSGQLEPLKMQVIQLVTERNQQRDTILELEEDLEAARDDTMPGSDATAQLKVQMRKAELKCQDEKALLRKEVNALEAALSDARKQPSGGQPSGGDPNAPPEYDFERPDYIELNDQDLTGEVDISEFGPATTLNFEFAIMRCKSGINNIRVSRALRGYAAGDARVAIRAARQALEIARALPVLEQNTEGRGRAFYWLGYALWYAYKPTEALDAFSSANLLLGNLSVPEKLKNDVSVWVDELYKRNNKGPTRERLPYAKLVLTHFWQEISSPEGTPVPM